MIKQGRRATQSRVKLYLVTAVTNTRHKIYCAPHEWSENSNRLWMVNNVKKVHRGTKRNSRPKRAGRWLSYISIELMRGRESEKLYLVRCSGIERSRSTAQSLTCSSILQEDDKISNAKLQGSDSPSVRLHQGR